MEATANPPAARFASLDERVAAVLAPSPMRKYCTIVDLTAITTPFGLLPLETQQALRDHGGPYQVFTRRGFEAAQECAWAATATYRVKPAPKRETVTLLGGSTYNWEFEDARWGGNYNTHRITFDLLDGKPDPASIRMEEL